MTGSSATPLLEIRNLKKYFPIEKGIFRRVTGWVKAVDDVSLTLYPGETLGLVGESGCGKTTLGRCTIRAIPASAGEILLHVDGEEIRIHALNRKTLRTTRRHMQMVFQDPYGSLDPRKTVLDIVGEPLRIQKTGDTHEIELRVRELMELVGLDVRYLKRYPHAFSGGQRQRIGIARALSLHPKLIVCDEPVSALDVSVQAQILNLLQDLQHEFALTYLFVAHDLSVIRHICSSVAVMYLGKIVEQAPTDVLFQTPKHPYTEALLSAIPEPDPDVGLQEILLEGDVPSPANPPPGCSFHTRCAYAEAVCRQEDPAWTEVQQGHFSACHFAMELDLRGVQD